VSAIVLTKPKPRHSKAAVVRLLETWGREPAYDTQAWPRVRRALSKHRLSRRPTLND